MWNTLKRFFIPEKDNNYKPHFFGTASVLFLTAVILVVFLVSTLQYTAISTGNYAAIITSVLTDLTNNDRLIEGKGWLATNQTLALAAQMKANDMAAKGYFAHTSPDGKSPWYWFKQAGYTFSYAGENLAVNFSDSIDVERAWMNSPGHRANIVNGKYTEIGIATAEGFYNGRSTIFVVQFFGRPAEATTTKSVAVATTATKAEEKNIEPVASEVAGAATGTGVLNKTLEVVSEDETFIAVKQNGFASVSEESATTAPAVQKTSFFARLFSSPQTFLQYAYALIAILIVIALIFDIVVEIRRQHPMHVVYATLLLALIFVLLYVSRTYIFSTLLII
ncbi:MAG: CAP domain-containing protein [Patescibacteria group bacterium]